MPKTTASLPIKIRGGIRESRYKFMWGEVTDAEDLLQSLEGEEIPEVIDEPPSMASGSSVIAMAGAETDPAPMLVSPTFADAHKFQSAQATITKQSDTTRNAVAAARLHASSRKARAVLNPSLIWPGGD